MYFRGVNLWSVLVAAVSTMVIVVCQTVDGSDGLRPR
jgi:hypothetical protein